MSAGQERQQQIEALRVALSYAPDDVLTPAAEALDALAARLSELQDTLAAIAAYDSHNDGSACRCGHRMSMCHAVNAATYCGGHPAAALARHALGKCPPVCFVCITEERTAAALALNTDGEAT